MRLVAVERAQERVGVLACEHRFDLRGQRNGVDLPGSPLSHVNNTSIDTKSNLDTLRGSLNSSFLFELPASWTAGGSLTLTFTVNPTGTLPETGPTPTADNAVVRTVSWNADTSTRTRRPAGKWTRRR